MDEKSQALVPLRHSTAHIMASAVLELFPGAKLGFGPAIEDGFYYDFELPRPLAPEDLPIIESRMKEIISGKQPFVHAEVSIDQARQKFAGQPFKLDQVEALARGEMGEHGEAAAKPTTSVSIYTHDHFTDLCRGPHIPNTGQVPLDAFKLLSIAGAYWRGNEKNPQLTRIYGTVWPSQAELDAYLEKLREIERRDHRTLGKDLELFRIDDELGSGLVLWLPNLSIVREELETWWRTVHKQRGYTLVYTPHIANEKIYQRSGHLEKYGENMYGPLALDEGTQNF